LKNPESYQRNMSEGTQPERSEIKAIGGIICLQLDQRAMFKYQDITTKIQIKQRYS
jgi:hypothetical protein